MPSKGIQCYFYIAAPGCEIEFTVPGRNLVKNQLRQFANDHLEVDKKYIKSPFSFGGTFAFKVSRNGQQVANESLDINVLSGDLEGGSMTSTENQLSVVTQDLIVNYGFYDAGPGVSGLPKSNRKLITKDVISQFPKLVIKAVALAKYPQTKTFQK